MYCYNQFKYATIRSPPGRAVYLHPAVADRVLLAAGGDHPSHQPGRAPAGEVPALHHDPRHPLRHGRSSIFQSLCRADDLKVSQLCQV